jgi:hypothetical protein
MTSSERATWASMLTRALRTVREAQRLQAGGGLAESNEIAWLESRAGDRIAMAELWLSQVETILGLDINASNKGNSLRGRRRLQGAPQQSAAEFDSWELETSAQDRLVITDAGIAALDAELAWAQGETEDGRRRETAP